MLHAEYHRLACDLLHALPGLSVAGIHLPVPVEDETVRDEFAFVVLSDGSVGPFYFSLGTLPGELWRMVPDPSRPDPSIRRLVDGFLAGQEAPKALAMGAFNALSRSLMRRAGYRPDVPAGTDGPAPGDTVGMVGYFGPLVERFTARGVNVRVLELAPERIPEGPGIETAANAGGLCGCDTILCTASTLINDTLDDIIGGVGDAGRIELIGPSGSGLPDIVFARGVAGVGGVAFDDVTQLLSRVNAGEGWGGAGQKYRISGDNYPGFAALCARAALAEDRLRPGARDAGK